MPGTLPQNRLFMPRIPSAAPQSPTTAPVTFAGLIAGGPTGYGPPYQARKVREALKIGYEKLARCKEYPGELSLAEVFRLAGLVQQPVRHVLAALLREVAALPAERRPAPPADPGLPSGTKPSRPAGRPPRDSNRKPRA